MKTMTMDGNTAAARISYAFSEIIIIYPITPSTPMAELSDTWATAQKTNVFGKVPKVVQMQSESGVAGALHGCLSCGVLANTYTCSQGLLLMQPNMYKMAGELLPTVFHVSARSLATHALSIFGDHQDVMACRQTGFAMLASSSVQEVMDLALVAHLATLKSSLPFVHFFDGFRTSHEMNKIEAIEEHEISSLLDESDVTAFRERALNPKTPIQRGTAQNDDVYFQNRERANERYAALPQTVQYLMDKTAQITGRKYHLFDYVGRADAEYVTVMMGSGVGAMEETVEKLCSLGEKVGLIKVRLFHPFCVKAFLDALPKTCLKIAVLDRSKEAGSIGEALYLDVCAALKESALDKIQVVGGRYGLSSKNFTPAMCYAVFQNLQAQSPKNHFTVGILDDVTNTSLPIPDSFTIEDTDATSCKFYGLGSDGTVGANKNSIKIIGERTDQYVQGYFQYDSRKSGGVTISHLRFGKRPIRSSYYVQNADFLACHNPSYLKRYDMLSDCKTGGVFLLNCPETDIQGLNAYLPPKVKRQIAEKRLSFYVIDATKIAREVGLDGRTSTIMQAAFFYLNPALMPYEKAKETLKNTLREKFLLKGEKVVSMNLAAVDKTERAVHKIEYPTEWISAQEEPLTQIEENAYVRDFMQPILRLNGDMLPTSAFQADGSVPTATSKYEKRGAPLLLPQWITENCIQCNQCSFVCPHACIRPFVFDESISTPESFSSKPAVGIKATRFKVQVSPMDCMGCGVCANVCPAKEKALVMTPSDLLAEKEAKNWIFAQSLPKTDTSIFKRNSIKGSQFYPPLFEFSYACSGCGETPYIKLLTQLFGERMLIANATGCSSIYGGSSPTCPYATNKDGHGPVWANSLFEDNAEFGYGMRLACDFSSQKQDNSVWIIGGDGWAYDIGYGGLDHVLASGANVNILVLDSEVYSNTGGQTSKATPLGAVARFSSGGKRVKKKNLGLMAMTYGNVYVAQVAMGANMQQTLTAFSEAEAYQGVSLIIAYSTCISHGFPMSKSMEEEKRAVESGHWTLYRFNPDLIKQNKSPFSLDSKPASLDFNDFMMHENRFASLAKAQPQEAKALFEKAKEESSQRRLFYEKLSNFFLDFVK